MSTLSYMPNAGFHSKDSGVKDNRLSNFPHVKAGRRDLSISISTGTWVARRANRLLSTTEPLQKNSSTKLPSCRKASNGNYCFFASQSVTREKPAGSQIRRVPFLPGLAATEQCKVSPHHLPWLSILHINFSSAKHCHF